jgi:hypothetical protein
MGYRSASSRLRLIGISVIYEQNSISWRSVNEIPKLYRPSLPDWKSTIIFGNLPTEFLPMYRELVTEITLRQRPFQVRVEEPFASFGAGFPYVGFNLNSEILKKLSNTLHASLLPTMQYYVESRQANRSMRETLTTKLKRNPRVEITQCASEDAATQTLELLKETWGDKLGDLTAVGMGLIKFNETQRPNEKPEHELEVYPFAGEESS